MSIATSSDFGIAAAPAHLPVRPLALAAGCVALADWLFCGWQIGISLAVFLAALGIAVSLALVVYASCFINAPRLVATYNIEHSRENGGTGPQLDLRYLASLGPQALPPVEAHVNKIPVLWSIARDYRHNYEPRRQAANWRGWDFRTWRLDRYLANNPELTQKPLGGDKG